MVPGDPGENGPSVPTTVVEELRPGRDAVTVQCRPRGGQTVRGRQSLDTGQERWSNVRRDSATLRLVVAKVKVLLAH